jgi:hypothetical protein
MAKKEMVEPTVSAPQGSIAEKHDVEVPASLKFQTPKNQEEVKKINTKPTIFQLLLRGNSCRKKDRASAAKYQVNRFALSGESMAIVWDEKAKRYIEKIIRYVPGESSIFADEQTPNAAKKVEDIIFEAGYITVHPTSYNLQQFLENDVRNRDNEHSPLGTRKLYTLLNTEKAETSRVVNFVTVSKVTNFVYDTFKEPLGNAALKAYAVTLGINVDGAEEHQIMNSFYSMINVDPKSFIEGFQNQSHNRKFYVMRAEKTGIISVERDTNVIKLNGQIVLNVPIGIDPIDYFVKKSFEELQSTYVHIRSKVDEQKLHGFFVDDKMLHEKGMAGVIEKVSALVDEIADL